MRTRISARQYYDTNPDQRHHTGDLWSGLPTHGLLPGATVPGIVITPACDLAQAKVETITYLPIVAVVDWFATTSFQAEALVVLNTESRLLGLDAPFMGASSIHPPSLPELSSFEASLSSIVPPDQRRREAHARCHAGLRLLRAILTPLRPATIVPDTKQLFGQKHWRQMLQQLVTNYRKDLHFLPADELPADWSILRQHSLVLFRYPLTAPVSIFDAAQEVSIVNWPAWTAENASAIPLATAFSSIRPLKGLSLRGTFLGDLLTRYAALYLRIGSPDFSIETVDEYVDQMEPR